MRITIDIDDPILKELKKLQQRERKSLGRLVSDLLAQSLASAGSARPSALQFEWIAKPMGARVDLANKHAVLDVVDARARWATASMSTSWTLTWQRCSASMAS